MNLSIAMLAVGLLFAGFGFYLWNYASLGGLSESATWSLPQGIAKRK